MLASKSLSEPAETLRLHLKPLDANNLADFKLLNLANFPVKYSERFYQECRAAESLTHLAYEGGKLLGGIACRLEPEVEGRAKAYIMTFCVYAEHRGQGIGTMLLSNLVETARQRPGICEVYLHVQISNTDAIDYYTKRGFQQGEVIHNYYRRIQPPHAVILRKLLTH